MASVRHSLWDQQKWTSLGADLEGKMPEQTGTDVYARPVHGPKHRMLCDQGRVTGIPSTQKMERNSWHRFDKPGGGYHCPCKLLQKMQPPTRGIERLGRTRDKIKTRCKITNRI
mmetsp:Transcript_4811/g.30537  ORF Transcript_4811/g.30537 Transcript_4811/m.30537 type:complete len:114 (-) Transcript_4811:1918-2259(-)